MLFRQLFDRESSTYSYLLADEGTREAALIDPVLEQADRDLEIVSQLGLTLVHVLETHVHADHVTAATRLREETGARTVAGRGGADCADVHVEDGAVIRIGRVALRVLWTPGHTDDSVSYLLVNPERTECAEDRVFTGDALLIRGAGRTDFQNGDAGRLYDSIMRALFTLSDATLVYPAHDYGGRTVTTIGEEKRWNARIAGRSRKEFIALMNALDLPEPKHIREAVPANRACGRAPVQVQG
jgi:glyoxylase-like metal-dependent hydrolase (beta-lactamase superfamily II)